MITRYDWIDYKNLMTQLIDYDIGVCLWLPIPKFFHNIPIKNFDYMAAGLPILTSNFGNVKKYLDISGAGIGIDPTNYNDFKNAILLLFEPENRLRFIQNSQRWIKTLGNFHSESKAYVNFILNC